jgi:hypothetical protein
VPSGATASAVSGATGCCQYGHARASHLVSNAGSALGIDHQSFNPRLYFDADCLAPVNRNGHVRRDREIHGRDWVGRRLGTKFSNA